MAEEDDPDEEPETVEERARRLHREGIGLVEQGQRKLEEAERLRRTKPQ